MSQVFRWVRAGVLDLYGDVRRFGVLVACLALGTAAIAAVGSVGASLDTTVVREARTLMGGDLEVIRPDRDATPEELATIEAIGEVAHVVDANARMVAGDESAFADVIAVAGNYPLLGSVTSPQLSPGQKPAALLVERDGAFGALVDEIAFERLGLAIGERFEMGSRVFEVRGTLTSLPDSATRGFHLGIPALITVEALAVMDGIRQPLPGLLTQHRYKIRLAGDDADAAAAALSDGLGDPGWLVRTPREAIGTFARYYDLFVRYLLMLGLASLLVGGVGISIAVTTYIGERQRSIATMRSLGATGARILVHFLTQIGVLTVIGIAIGLVLGALASVVALPVIGNALGVELHALLDLPSLLTASAFGLLASFAFSYSALAGARQVSPVTLFRSLGTEATRLRLNDYRATSVWLPLLIALLAIYALALWTTGDLLLVNVFAGGMLLAFVVLRIAADVLQVVLKRLPESPLLALRHAMRGIHLPGSPAAVVVLSLGLGLTMVVIITVLNTNLQQQLLGAVTRDAPTFVATDVFLDEIDVLQQMSGEDADFVGLEWNPSVRGRIVAVAGVETGDLPDVGPEAALLLGVDVPVTWSAMKPDDGEVVEGEWWPEDYDGPALVSLPGDLRDELDLEVGDELQFEIFGDLITAKVASFRAYRWQNGMNFGVVFSPGEIEAYPSTYLASIKAAPGAEKRLERSLVAAFPEIAFLPIGEALGQAARAIGELATGINVVAALAVLNGLLVLAGTMAAGRKRREADAVVQKVLGATRREVLWEFVLEYGLLGVFAALMAALLGIGAAWAITSRAIGLDFAVDPIVITLVAGAAVLLTVVVGAVTTWRSLSTSPGLHLREAR